MTASDCLCARSPAVSAAARQKKRGSSMRPPEFAALQAVHSPDDGCVWHEAACFAGDFIVAKLDGPAGCFTAIDRDGVIRRLDDPEDGWLVGGPDGTWFAATSAGFRRYRLLAS